MRPVLELPTVLLVDDEPDLCNALARIMKSQNIPFEQAENGKVALELLRARKFHAVLCDIMMPELTGLQCLAQAQVEGIFTPFIFLTGYCDSERMLQAIRLGAVDFIAKPFDNNEVLDVVYKTLYIGARMDSIISRIKETNSDLLESVKKDERMISLLRVNNNKKRIA